jgi:hypothetical protein
MNRIQSLLGPACVGALMAFGCSQSGPGESPVTGGTASGGNSTTGATAGTIATAGTNATAGNSSQAGAAVGGAATGGVATSGGSPAGGAPIGGAGGNISGGAAAGGTTAAGAGGAAGGSGGGGLTPAEIVPDLQGYYWEGTCAGSIAVEGHNCPMSDASSSCPSSGINREKSIDVKGVSGQLYIINIEVRGVIGTRCYTGGTRASSAALDETGNNNWWYSGGTYANPTGWWNTYELHVSPPTGDASGDVYYFNGSDVQGGNSCEREATYLVNYKASFKAKGGGKLTFKIHDQNCKGQQNCGSNPDGTSACAPRTVDLSGMAASPPANFTQPPSNSTYKPQWMLIAVTSITTAPSP